MLSFQLCSVQQTWSILHRRQGAVLKEWRFHVLWLWQSCQSYRSWRWENIPNYWTGLYIILYLWIHENNEIPINLWQKNSMVLLVIYISIQLCTWIFNSWVLSLLNLLLISEYIKDFTSISFHGLLQEDDPEVTCFIVSPDDQVSSKIWVKISHEWYTGTLV